MTIKAAVIGSTGYAGEEVVRLLLQHPQVTLMGVTSHSYAGKPFEDVYPHFEHFTDLICREERIEELSQAVDVLFLALPHGHAAKMITPDLLRHTRVIDLGADFRLADPKTYETWYGIAHPTPDLLHQAIYGIVELNRPSIRQAQLIANPGCYPTCSILPLTPLIKEKIIQPETLVIDAKSGVTGAGRSLNLALHYAECSESIKAYGLAKHRHTPEIEQAFQLFADASTPITFTPHLAPMNRGILVTAYAQVIGMPTESDIHAIYRQYYGKEPFIRLLPIDRYPETRWVKGSNFCDIGFCLDPRTRRIIVVAAIDNLVKGAAGQAVQNMNLMFQLAETTGLMTIPLFPG